MTKLFIDSDIILDVLLRRKHYRSAAKLLTAIDEKKAKGFTTPIVFTNVHYIMTKYEGRQRSIQNLRKLRRLLSVLSITEEMLDEALMEDSVDFEDAIQYVTAERNGMDFIITRNIRDYKKSRVPALDAADFVKMIGNR